MTLGCKALQWTTMCFNSVIKPQGQHPGECWFNPTFSHMFIKVIYLWRLLWDIPPPSLEASGMSHDSFGGYCGTSHPPLWRPVGCPMIALEATLGHPNPLCGASEATVKHPNPHSRALEATVGHLTLLSGALEATVGHPPPSLEASGMSHDSFGGYCGTSHPPFHRPMECPMVALEATVGHPTPPSEGQLDIPPFSIEASRMSMYYTYLQDNQIHHAEHSEGPMSQIKWGQIVQLQMVTTWWV
ncbi:hypothetical protein F5J12DRAFT_785062 [Pisolithus orientalis]|uniref:uncharacterized protein n=1 Tax=Pisolithus orientalis TaxID=936130 RepID=UPI0022246A61|nr:uncharacterized protein F5J12DRAFT_785062 [Pisolithus orientalis]KAI5997847.1 hypothetical protein F5J12DRAFT_785062 [Pisolithus orientalis]